MAKRLPRPSNAARPRVELSAEEMEAVENAAHLARLSVASFIRVALIDAARNAASRKKAWAAVAAEIEGAAPEAKPKKKPDAD